MSKPFRDPVEFRHWNEEMARKYDSDLFYARSPWILRHIEHKRIQTIMRLLHTQAAERVLEVGCGAGHLLEQVPAGWLVGIDICETQMQRAYRRLRGKTQLILGMAEALPFPDETFDKVYCSEVLEHVLSPEKALGEINRVLRYDGRAVISAPNDRLINRLKRVIRLLQIAKILFRRQDIFVPDLQGNEWHLNVFDALKLRELSAVAGLKAYHYVSLPFRWVPLHLIALMKRETMVASSSNNAVL